MKASRLVERTVDLMVGHLVVLMESMKEDQWVGWMARQMAGMLVGKKDAVTVATKGKHSVDMKDRLMAALWVARKVQLSVYHLVARTGIQMVDWWAH